MDSRTLFIVLALMFCVVMSEEGCGRYCCGSGCNRTGKRAMANRRVSRQDIPESERRAERKDNAMSGCLPLYCCGGGCNKLLRALQNMAKAVSTSHDIPEIAKRTDGVSVCLPPFCCGGACIKLLKALKNIPETESAIQVVDEMLEAEHKEIKRN